MTYTNTPRVEQRRGRAPFLFVLALVGAALLLLTACVGGDDEDAAAAERVMATSADDAPADFAEDAAAEEAPMAEPDEGTATAGEASRLQAGTDGAALAVPTALTPADLGREIVYRATISVQADDVTAASNEAVAIVQGLG
ncbi:MAG: hypothetical protein F4Y13_09590, partial [Acidimicrobiaceae bacterium]|nr:hypothetical protein [Acidimicrobiaceae bacterium]